jgi:hypothetical protein
MACLLFPLWMQMYLRSASSFGQTIGDPTSDRGLSIVADLCNENAHQPATGISSNDILQD